MAAPRSHSTSATASNMAAFSLNCSLGCSVLCGWKMTSIKQQKGSTGVPGQMTGSVNVARLRGRIKVGAYTMIKDTPFADDAAVATQIRPAGMGLLRDRFSQACNDFGLTIRLLKINIVGQDTGTTCHHDRLLRTRRCLPVHIPSISSSITDNL